MDAQKVKGTMLLDFVRMIRKNKHLDWKQHLAPEDWPIINATILPAVWYPVGVYVRCSVAAFHLMGKGSLEVARSNGQMIAGHMFESTYKSLLQSKDPVNGLNRFVFIFGSLFNFPLLKVETLGPGHAKFSHVAAFDERAAVIHKPAFAYQLMGFLEKVVEMTGGKRARSAVSAKEWEGAPATILDITWD